MKKLVITWGLIVFLSPFIGCFCAIPAFAGMTPDESSCAIPAFAGMTRRQEKPVLKFKSDGKFKIVQFTDIHLQYDSNRSDSALVMMKIVIEREKPDLVMLTGDVVGSDNRKKAWLKVAQVMIDAKTPWAAMLGNHDAEYELDKEQTMKVITGLPYGLTESGPREIAGAGNYVLPIQSAKSNQTIALCYVFDSEVKRPSKDASGIYEWIDNSQVAWYRSQSAAFAKQNDGKPLPALAFFHIPFPEYTEVTGRNTTYGFHLESEFSVPGLHSNLYVTMQECKDVMSVFVGHEHNNNAIGCLNGICLAYGQTSGRQVYGDLGCGARVIELYEGQRKFDSWILKLYDNNRETDLWTPTNNTERMFFVTYPDSFDEQKLSSGKINMTTTAVGEFSISMCGTGIATIDWGDGSPKEQLTLSEDNDVAILHTYKKAPLHHIAINGDNVTALDCKRCSLTRLDVSRNTELKVLWCNGNHLTGLDVSENPKLTELYCYNNRLTNLDVNNNTALIWLNCYGNLLTGLDISHNTVMRRLDSYENQLTDLDFSKNTALQWVVCSDNQLTAAALNSLFSTLQVSTTSRKIYIGGNPGENDCDRNIAKNKGWTISNRY